MQSKIVHIRQIFDSLKKKEKKRLVVVWPKDNHTIEAVNSAVEMSIVDVFLVGNKQEIRDKCKEVNIDYKKFIIKESPSDVEAASFAVNMVANGEADILMKGLISTDKFMKAILNKNAGLIPFKGVLSHVSVLENSFYHKLLIVSDVAIIPKPNIYQKEAMANYLISTAHSLGIVMPKVAVISASEQVLTVLESSTEAAVIAKMGDRKQINGAIIDGPLSLDAAIDKETVKVKNIVSPVAGDADCLLFPNLDAANIFYKMNSKLSKAQMATFVAGAKVPIVLSSRGDTAQTKLNSIALCTLLT